MISLKALSKRYGDTLAVSDLSFEVQPREVMGFLGPNGAGKTTTLRVLSGYLAPTSGTATLAGCDVQKDSLELRRRVGYLPENNPLYEDMDVAEYLDFTARVRDLRPPHRSERIRSAVESCTLGDVLTKPIGLLSKGFRQRVGLAAAILHDPQILLLDEPTSGLDPNQTREVRELINRLKREKTVLLSTHILPEVEASCDRVVILKQGRMAACGTIQELLAKATSSPKLRLVLRNADPEAVRAILSKLQGVANLTHETSGAETVFSLEAAEDLREAVFRTAVDRGWTLLELGRVEASLESVFQELAPS
ncbi:MAG: ATP-binding cassette domain-containing protein [Elusimicrobiota bacterium]